MQKKKKLNNWLIAIIFVAVVAVAFVIIVAITFGTCQQQPASETIRGKVIDATMNNIMLVTEEGDTTNISTMDADHTRVPGVKLYDVVEVTYEIKDVNNNKVKQATDLVIKTPSPYRQNNEE